MAIGWTTALKLVPWGDVIAAAPEVVQAARRLLRKTRRNAPHDDAADSAGALPHDGAPSASDLAHLVHDLDQRVAQLEREQREAAVLMQSLAEQNARLVQAIDALRWRQQWMVLAVATTAALGLGLFVWALVVQ